MIVNKEKYISRMEEATIYKIALLNELNASPQMREPGVVILDYGCGSGLLSFIIANQFPNASVIGYDSEIDMIKEAKKRYEAPNLTFTTERLLSLKYDAIVLSSVVHEVYSNLVNPTGFLLHLKYLLKDEGQIVIRDGFKQSDKYVKFYIHDVEEARWFLTTLKESKFGSYYSSLSIKDDSYLCGNLYAVAEFLNKYTWGRKSIEREKNEIIGFWSVEKWMELNTLFDITIKEVKADDYFRHLNKLVYIPERDKWNTHVLVSLKNK